MQAMILAAGMGKRLKDLTADNTKCMVKVNGVSLIERAIRHLEKAGLSRLVMVVGYEAQKLIDHIESLHSTLPIVYIHNPVYATTNNIYSLALAKEWLLKEDTLLLESDIIFDYDVIDALLSDPRDTLTLVDKYEAWMDGTVVKLDEEDNITDFIPGSLFRFDEKDEYYKTVNIYKFSREFSRTRYVPFLEAYTATLGNNEYYEQVLRVITMLDEPVIRARRLTGQKWYEIDDLQDLDIATSLFAESEVERYERVTLRFGGFWRYPRLLDFCYLVNPYFPPQKMLDEIRASFDTLVTQYPSGMHVNAMLAARNFGLREENILVGNGAAELIEVLMRRLEGQLGFIRPTFEEYPNRCAPERTVVYRAQAPDFSYTAEDLIAHFSGSGIEALVLINPDNPSGSYIDRSGLETLLAWSEREGIRLVLDESFADFADEPDNTLFDREVLRAHPSLIVVKSISKSYGIPGLRLGVLASGDTELIAALKKDVSIWNINSPAEFYMQIAEKYRKPYAKALERFREVRSQFYRELSTIPQLRVIPSQANYFMLELTEGDSKALAVRLLSEDDILIKDLSHKLSGGQYIRVAVRTAEENHRLVEAMRRHLG